mmetsp:Transcript_15190/g.38540  ORF Transcript_15190/g.38540 Transcript_15190/m.38540 type:complete len:95 (-) Transcript_15190:618-902(-)
MHLPNKDVLALTFPISFALFSLFSSLSPPPTLRMDKELESYMEGRALEVRSLQRTTFGAAFDDSAYNAEQPMFPLVANIRREIRDFWGPAAFFN